MSRVSAPRGQGGFTRTTASLRPAEVEKHWIVIDAADAVLGRLASFIAMRLRGKHRADYTPHVDCGDHVVVVNAEKVRLTGKKESDKVYYWHTGHPGGVKQRTAENLLNGRYPERVLQKAVERMLPKESPLARKQLTHLRVYPGPDHPHQAQGPHIVDFGDMNRKNVHDGRGRQRTVIGHAVGNRGGLVTLRFEPATALAPAKPAATARLAPPDATAADYAELIESLTMAAEAPEEDARIDALMHLARLVPTLDYESSIDHPPLLHALRVVPDRLMNVLTECLPSSRASKAAALAIAACMRPRNYRETPVTENEAQARKDLEDIFAKSGIRSFSRVAIQRARHAVIDADLWTGFSFTLDGEAVFLEPVAWLDPEASLDVRPDGARALKIEVKTRDELRTGQFGAIRAVLEPDPTAEEPDVVILYLAHGRRVFDRYVYDADTLFAPT
jgi:large subunit ribosomal protein L13